MTIERLGGWAVRGRLDDPAPAQPLNRSTALKWSLLLDPAPRPGFENMALDCTLLHAAQDGQGFLRIYRWDPACLSFGRNEPALTRYNRDRIEQRGLDTVRRPTGGRAVWHHDEVTYAVAAPANAFGSLPDSYTIIHAMIVRALKRMDVPCSLAPAPRSRLPALAAGACFAGPAGGEVIANGRKLVGSAQIREGSAFLQHGSILLTDGQEVVTAVTRGPAPAPAATSLSALLGRPVEFSEVATAIVREVRDAWGSEQHGAGSLDPEPGLVSRFADPAWTWRR